MLVGKGSAKAKHVGHRRRVVLGIAGGKSSAQEGLFLDFGDRWAAVTLAFATLLELYCLFKGTLLN